MKTDYFEGPKTRQKRLAKVASYTPESLVEELSDSDGTLEIQSDGTLKMIGTGHLPSVWHEAFAIHRKAVLAITHAHERKQP